MGRRGISLKYLHSYTDRYGKERFYFRRNGKSTPLPGLPGSREFMDAYAACLGDGAPSVRAMAEIHPRSLRALAIRYYASANYQDLSDGSKSIYRRTLEPFLVEHGHRRADQMQRVHVIAIVGGMADRPGAASMLLKRLRVLLRFGIDLGWMKSDPTLRVKGYRSTELHTWTEEELAQFEARWPLGTKQRLAFGLLLYTGQRGSDVRRMVWTDIVGASIRVAQQKTGTKLVIPLHPRLQELLADARKTQASIMATEYGAAFSVKGFGQFVSAAIQAAGLPTRCKAHGLRKAAARRLADAGCSANQIASVTGHKTLAEVERYTRAADQERLAKEAIAKQQSANKTG
jgi:enterobacteria phage integrase